MEKSIVCTVCPQGCRIQVTGEGEHVESVSGFTCPRGEKYARQEFVCPMRILTGTVRICGSDEPLLPVRSASPVPRDKIPEAMRELRKVCVTTPVKAHQVIVQDILHTGVDIVACCGRDK